MWNIKLNVLNSGISVLIERTDVVRNWKVSWVLGVLVYGWIQFFWCFSYFYFNYYEAWPSVIGEEYYIGKIWSVKKHPGYSMQILSNTSLPPEIVFFELIFYTCEREMKRIKSLVQYNLTSCFQGFKTSEFAHKWSRGT